MRSGCSAQGTTLVRVPPNWFQTPLASWWLAHLWLSTQSPSTLSPTDCSFATHLRNSACKHRLMLCMFEVRGNP